MARPLKVTSDYQQKLKDPRWQKKRLEILERDDWTCQNCFDYESTLVVHHRSYLPNVSPWDYPDDSLVTLCEECHENEKDKRPGCEHDLLVILRNHFLAEDIRELAQGFQKMKLLHSHEIVAGVYEWALSTPEIQRDLIDRYFAQLKESIHAKR